MKKHIKWMKKALKLADEAAGLGEVPVGAIIVKDDKIIGAGFNRRESHKNALAHAEIEAINKACEKLKGWRLVGATLYVTLEPCPMCAGAIINSRIDEVVFGAWDHKSGSSGSVINLFEEPYNHKPKYLGGVLEEECAQRLTDFFKNLRNS